jgi:hypothetical protein
VDFSTLCGRKGRSARRETRAYNAKVSYLLSTLSLGTTAGLGTDEFVLHAIGEIEATRRRIVADARLLSKPGKSDGEPTLYCSLRRSDGAAAIARTRP